VSVRPCRGSFEPVGVAHPVTSHIEPVAAEARPVRSRGPRVKHDAWSWTGHNLPVADLVRG
jgi:hypothetical protein